MLMPQIKEILCHQISTHTVIKPDMGFAFHLGIVALYKHIRYFVKIQLVIQTPVPA